MSENEERVLIGSVRMGKTKGGKPVAELYSTDTRLEFPVLTLFDLSMLELVGIDPNSLGAEPVYRRFWAHYALSEKINKEGNNYKDCLYLEPLGTGDNPGGGDELLTELLAEVRAIRTLLEILLSQQGGGHQGRKRLPVTVTAPRVNLVRTDQDAIVGELAVHDQVQAGPSPLDEYFPREAKVTVKHEPEPAPLGIPTGGTEMVAYLNRTLPTVNCQGPGHLLYVMKKVNGPDWGWPNSEDADAWQDVVRDWTEYWKAIA